MYNFSQYPTHHICESFTDVCDMFNALKDPQNIVALDTETSGLSPYVNHIVGYAFGSLSGHGYYVPIRHKENPIKDKELVDIQDFIQDWLEKTPDVKKVFWNAKFDIKMFKREGIKLSGPIEDGMLLLALTNKPLNFSKLSLKTAAKEVLGLETIGKQFLDADKRGKGAYIDKMGYGIMNYTIVGFYAAEDAIFTMKLYQHFLKNLDAPNGN